MEKISMRDYLAALEERVDKSLHKWKKTSRTENGEVVQVQWQFEQSHVFVDVFWHDGIEGISVDCRSPRHKSNNWWSGLNADSADRVMDKIGNFAQIVQYRDHYRI